MQPYSIAPIVMASLSCAAALPECGLLLRKKGTRLGLPFVLTCFGLALYCVACAGLYSVTTTVDSVPWSRFQTISFCIMGICFILFLSEYTHLFPKAAVYLLVAIYSAGVVCQVVSALPFAESFRDLTWVVGKPLVKHVGIPHLFSLTIYEVETGPLNDFLQVSGFITLSLMIRAVVIFLRTGRRKNARALGFVIGVISTAFTVDFLVTHDLLHIPYTLEYSWLGVILIMNAERNRELQEGQEAKQALVASERKFKAMIDESFDIIAVCDVAGQASYLSPSFTKVLGYPTEDFLGRSLGELVHPDDLALLREANSELPDSQTIAVPSFRMRRENGEWAIMEAALSSFPAATAEGGLLITGRDITEKTRAEEAILASLSEKEILLKEVHHRVKNNLQIISSLLNLQARRCEDSKAAEALEVAKNRMLAMTLVHEELYRQPNVARIDIGSCMKTIAQRLVSAANRDIRLTVMADKVELGLYSAIPLALIVNECVSNSLKHAFPESAFPGGGEIRIELSKADEGYARLRVSDNGKGACATEGTLEGASGVDSRFASEARPIHRGLGMTLIKSLLSPIQGRLSLETEAGFAAVVDFSTAEELGQA